MNSSTLANSTTPIGVYSVVWPQFIYSSICLVGAFTVSVNISVFCNKKLTDRTYNFLLVEAIVDLLYISMMSCSSIINCGSPCDSRSNTLWAQIIRFCIYEYLTSCFAINNILIEIFLSIERLYVISNRQLVQRFSFRPVVFTIGIFSLVYYSPILFRKKILYLDINKYKLVMTAFGDSEAGKIIPGVLSSIRLLLATIGLFSINIVTFIKFKKHVKNKSKLKGYLRIIVAKRDDDNSLTTGVGCTSETTSKAKSVSTAIAAQKQKSNKSNDSKAKRNLTLMIVSISFLFTIGTLPWAVYYTLATLTSISNLYPLQVVASCCLYLLISFKIFVFYFFNRLFRQVIDENLKVCWNLMIHFKKS